MKRTITAASVASALALAALSAHAGCADPRVGAPQSAFAKLSPLTLHAATAAVTGHSDGEGAAENIVGTWHVMYTAGGAPFGEALIQWHSDGTEWENIAFPILGGNICLGSWKAVDGSRVTRNHIGWLYTNGILSGYFTETETDVVARDGNSYQGTSEQKVYDLEGNLLVEVPGTSAATRIAP